MKAYYHGTKIEEFVEFLEGDARGWAVVRLENCDFEIAVLEAFIVIE